MYLIINSNFLLLLLIVFVFVITTTVVVVVRHHRPPPSSGRRVDGRRLGTVHAARAARSEAADARPCPTAPHDC